jgi:hypothetical protein
LSPRGSKKFPKIIPMYFHYELNYKSLIECNCHVLCAFWKRTMEITVWFYFQQSYTTYFLLTRLSYCITVLTATTWKSAPLLPRETVVLVSRKIEQNDSYIRTGSEGEFVFLVTSYRTQGRQHFYAHGTPGTKYTWYFMFYV